MIPELNLFIQKMRVSLYIPSVSIIFILEVASDKHVFLDK